MALVKLVYSDVTLYRSPVKIAVVTIASVEIRVDHRKLARRRAMSPQKPRRVLKDCGITANSRTAARPRTKHSTFSNFSRVDNLEGWLPTQFSWTPRYGLSRERDST